MTRDELRNVWRAQVAEFHASGQSVAAWCRAHDVKEHQLRYWLRRVDAQPHSSGRPMTSWLAVEVQGERQLSPAVGVRIHVGAAAIEVRPGFDPELLADVVRALTALC